jgi:hypothetical protein
VCASKGRASCSMRPSAVLQSGPIRLGLHLEKIGALGLGPRPGTFAFDGAAQSGRVPPPALLVHGVGIARLSPTTPVDADLIGQALVIHP